MFQSYALFQHMTAEQNFAGFPVRAQQARLEMLRDLDRNQRCVLSRIWTEIKLR